MLNNNDTALVERTLTQADFDAFAKLSGDDNPIHVNPKFASATAFGRTVSHGMLLYSILRGLAENLIPGARQLSQELMFPAPAYAGDPLRFAVAILTADDGVYELEMKVSTVADNTTVCSGSGRFQWEAGADRV